MATIFTDGFESGDTTGWDGHSGTVTVNAGSARTGGFGASIPLDGTANVFINTTKIGTNQTVFVARVYFRLSVLPTNDTEISLCDRAGAGDDLTLYFKSADSKVHLFHAGADVTGPAVTSGVWYRLDWRWNLSSGGNKVADWQIDGVAQTSSSVAGTDTGVTKWWCGAFFSGTGTALYDDAAASVTSGDYPLGPVGSAVVPYAVPLGPGPGRISPSGIWTLAPSDPSAVSVNADTTTGAGAANDAAAATTVNADTTTATGTAFDATVDVGVAADTATAAGTAFDAYLSATELTAGPYTGPAPGRYSPSGVWTLQPGDPSATGASVLVATAETTTAVATAFDATVDVGVAAETTTATGTAGDAQAGVGAAAATTTAAGTAYDGQLTATVNAETTTGAGAALDAAAGIGVAAETTTAVGTAYGATVDLAVNAELAAATGTAYDATVTGTGAAISPAAECATATATAYNATVTIVQGARSGSWYTLVDIGRAAADEDALWRRRPPTACPHDGEPLQPVPGSSILHCPADGYQWPRDRTTDWG